MGNKLGRKRQVVDERYTRPQGLYEHKDVDHKKLRKLILDSKLAPCYPGDEEGSAFDLEECPICFLHYPSLNRSRCCTKGICTECFLQMKPPHSTRPTQCPFCKTSSYAVEYRGVRSKEEKGMEQIEEQRVIEAKIRMQQQELLDEEERMQVRQECSSSTRIMSSGEVGYRDIASNSLAVPSFSLSEEVDEISNHQIPCAVTSSRLPSRYRRNREGQFDQDLEDIMVMEAIWLSIQENGTESNLPLDCEGPSDRFDAEDCYTSPTTASLDEAASPSTAQQLPYLSRDSIGENASNFDVLAESGRIPIVGEERECYNTDHWVAVSQDSANQWRIDHGSVMAQMAPSYGSSDVMAHSLRTHDGNGILSQPNITGTLLPGSYEEQVMFASAVSLAEAQGRAHSHSGVPWL